MSVEESWGALHGELVPPALFEAAVAAVATDLKVNLTTSPLLAAYGESADVHVAIGGRRGQIAAYQPDASEGGGFSLLISTTFSSSKEIWDEVSAVAGALAARLGLEYGYVYSDDSESDDETSGPCVSPCAPGGEPRFVRRVRVELGTSTRHGARAFLVDHLAPERSSAIEGDAADVAERVRTSVAWALERSPRAQGKVSVGEVVAWIGKDFEIDQDDCGPREWRLVNGDYEARLHCTEDAVELRSDVTFAQCDPWRALEVSDDLSTSWLALDEDGQCWLRARIPLEGVTPAMVLATIEGFFDEREVVASEEEAQGDE